MYAASRLQELFATAGFRDVRVTWDIRRIVYDSFDDYWEPLFPCRKPEEAHQRIVATGAMAVALHLAARFLFPSARLPRLCHPEPSASMHSPISTTSRPVAEVCQQVVKLHFMD